MRRLIALALAMLVVLAGAALSAARPATKQPGSQSYVVLYKLGVPASDARAAVRAAGGRIVRENLKVRVATARSSNPRFLTAASRSAAIEGVARDKRIGFVPRASRNGKGGGVDKFAFEKGDFNGEPAGSAATPGAAVAGADPLAALQWDMRMIRATPEGSHAVQPGARGVRVGIIDTGIDGSHPDVAANFNAALSRNFTTDIPVDSLGNEIDGPCAEEPDGSCSDPADVDEAGHGTHVAGTVAAAANGIGVTGVAPKVTLVNLRAGQDSGFFFLQPSVDALTYAGDNGIDVVNMSYFIDPWLFNCKNNPADSPAEQLEQQTIIKATERALGYAHRHGVTLVAAAGNEAIDYSKTVTDATSPDFPLGTEKEREVPPSCLDLPTEGKNVLAITALGPRSGSRSIRPMASVSPSSRPRAATRSTPPPGWPTREPDPLHVARVRRPHRRHRARRDPRRRSADRQSDLQPDHLRAQERRLVHVLRVPAGHVDGLAARDRRGGGDRERVRQARQEEGRARTRPRHGREDHAEYGPRARLSHAQPHGVRRALRGRARTTASTASGSWMR